MMLQHIFSLSAYHYISIHFFLIHQHKNVRSHPGGGALGLTETMSVCIGKGHGVWSAEKGTLITVAAYPEIV